MSACRSAARASLTWSPQPARRRPAAPRAAASAGADAARAIGARVGDRRSAGAAATAARPAASTPARRAAAAPGRSCPTGPRAARPAELEQQRPEVAGVEQLDPDVRVELAQAAQLAVLLAHELLLERGELDVQVEVGEVEVRREALDHLAAHRPADRERVGLVLPADLVEVEDPRQLRLARVGEGGTGAGIGARRPG